MKRLEELNFGFTLTQNPCTKTFYRDTYCTAKKKEVISIEETLMKLQAQ